MLFIMLFMLSTCSNNNYHYVLLSQEFLAPGASINEYLDGIKDKRKNRAVALCQKFFFSCFCCFLLRRTKRGNVRTWSLKVSKEWSEESFSCIFTTIFSSIKRSVKCKWHLCLCSLKTKWASNRKQNWYHWIM